MNTNYGGEGGGDAPITLENFRRRAHLPWTETKVTEEIEK